MKEIEPFFNPRSIALIGVSRDMNKFNGVVLKNLLEVDYQGKIYPVNPYAKEILGVPCYAKIVDLPEIPELGVILHSDVIPILENCGKKGMKNIIIQADIALKDDEEQEKILNEIMIVTKKYEINFIGPSLIGLINFTRNFTTSIIPVRGHIARRGKNLERAGIAFLAQSGGLAGACGWWSPSQDVGISKVLHLGKKIPGAIGIESFLEYFVEDPEIKVITLFLRQIDERLINAVKKHSKKKPILFRKCGKPIGVEGLVDAGAFKVNNYLDLFEIAKAFIFSPLPRGNRVALIGPSSGAIDLVLSEFKNNDLAIAEPSMNLRDKIKDLFQNHEIRRCNPLDYWPPPRFYGHEVGKVHHTAADLLLSDDNVDALFLILEFFHEIEFDLMLFKNIVEKYPDKPILGVLIQAEMDGAQRMENAATILKIPIYKEAERLVKAFSLLYKFSKNKEP
ncbi:MAG: CoA-binding protein [Promethearchaeota archaeon]